MISYAISKLLYLIVSKIYSHSCVMYTKGDEDTKGIVA